MIVLLCGGPHAGRVLAWPDPLPPTIVFPRMPRLSWRAFYEDPSLEIADVVVRDEYRQGSMLETVAGVVCGYHFTGEDKYRTARTLERLVPFAAPRGLEDLDDKISVDWLLVSCGIKP